MEKELKITPFSNGTEAQMWYDENCCNCTKAFFPKGYKNYPSDNTMKKYCSIGKECYLKYAIDWSFVTSEISIDVANEIGLDEIGRLKKCSKFSDNDDDRFNYPSKPKPDNTPNNQLVMPIILNEIESGKKIKVLV